MAISESSAVGMFGICPNFTLKEHYINTAYRSLNQFACSGIAEDIVKNEDSGIAEDIVEIEDSGVCPITPGDK